MTLVDLHTLFSTEDKAREYLKRIRWPHGVTCPRCQHTAVSVLRQQRKYECAKCEYQFSLTSGTIFHDSRLSLEKWFLAVLLLCEAKKGMSALQLKRSVGVSYKTAWYLCHRIRAAMKDADTDLLSGVVEVDETYIGGKRRGAGRGAGMDNKTMVLGAIQRGGQLRLKVDNRADRKTLRRFINTHTKDETEAIFTDDWRGYWGIGDHNTVHDTVNHSKEEWVRGQVHTNTIESAFSLFKRGVVGSFHHLSAKHLQAYLDEFVFRYNRRKNRDIFADTLKRLMKSEAMPFKKLTANTPSGG
jgi:transposase-like protein